MDGKLHELKQWKCKNNHVLGIIERVQVSSDGRKYHVTRLMLFRHAIDLEPESFVRLEDVDVLANIEGTANIRCSCCNEIRTWWMGEAAMERFLEKVKHVDQSIRD